MKKRDPIDSLEGFEAAVLLVAMKRNVAVTCPLLQLTDPVLFGKIMSLTQRLERRTKAAGFDVFPSHPNPRVN